MTTTTPSQKRTTRMYFFVLHAFIFFMMAFQNKVSAQDAVEKNVTKAMVTRTESMIKSTSTDKEIYDKVDFYKNEFELLLKFKKISRNINGEINALKITFSDEKGDKKSYNVSDSEPIVPFTIYVDKDENKEIIFGFGDASSSMLIEENIENQKLADAVVAVANEAALAKKAIEAMGEMTSGAASSGDDDISLIKRDKELDYTKAFISLDGKEIFAAELDKIDPKSIGSISKMNGKNNARLVEKYGARAQNGIILIESLFILKPLTSAEIEALPTNFKLDPENGAFIIHKLSQASDLEFYTKQLAQIDVTLQISGLERNSEGLITNLKLKLADEIQKVKMSDWTVFKNANGIANIFVGRKNGKINISAR